MDKSIKNDVLEMLKQFMMGEHGKRMKPAAVTVEVVTPMKGKGGSLEEVLDKAAKKAPEVDELGEPADMDGDGDHDEDDHMLAEEMEDEDCDPKKKKKSLRDFFDR